MFDNSDSATCTCNYNNFMHYAYFPGGRGVSKREMGCPVTLYTTKTLMSVFCTHLKGTDLTPNTYYMSPLERPPHSSI